MQKFMLRLKNTSILAAIVVFAAATVLYATPRAKAATAPAGETAGQYFDDAAISTRVRAGLLGDTQLQGSRINVETDKSLVHLTGLVNSKAQEAEAVRIASRVNGVHSVRDHLVLRGQL